MSDDTRLQNTSPADHYANSSTGEAGRAASAKPFLDLPPEIRNMVYHYLSPGGRSAVQLLTRNTGPGFIRMSDRLGILTTCRQVYEEATSFLHAERRFTVKQAETLTGLIQKLGLDFEDDSEDAVTNRILRYVVPWDQNYGIDLEYDLDKQILITDAPGLMYTDHLLCELCTADVNVQLTATSKSTSAKSAFQGFRTLRTWIENGHSDIHWYVRYVFGPKVVLAFDIPTPSQHADVRFDATAFLHAVRQVTKPGLWEVKVRVCGKSITRFKTVSQLQCRMLLFMWQMMQGQAESRTDTCPTIWMDEQLQPREAEFLELNGEARIVANQYMSDGQTPEDHAHDKRIVDALANLEDPDYHGRGDKGQRMVIEARSWLKTESHKDSLLRVAADLAQQVKEDLRRSYRVSW